MLQLKNKKGVEVQFKFWLSFWVSVLSYIQIVSIFTYISKDHMFFLFLVPFTFGEDLNIDYSNMYDNNCIKMITDVI